jgi:transposase
VRAFAAIGGVPHLLVPDNTKTAVIKACHYDPQVNRTYADTAAQGCKRFGGVGVREAISR